MLSTKKTSRCATFLSFLSTWGLPKYSIYIYNIQYKYEKISIWFYLYNLRAAKTGYFYAHIYHPVTSCDSCPHQWPPHRWRHGVRNCSRGSRCRSCGPKGVVPGSRDGPNRAWMMWIRWPCEPWKHHKKNMVSWNASRNRSLNIPFTSHYVYIYVHICTYIPLVSLISHQRTIMYLYIYILYIYILYIYIYCIYIYCIYILYIYIYIYCIYIYIVYIYIYCIFIYIRH